MPLSIESEIDLLYHLSTMSEHVLPKGMFYLLLWKRLNQSGHPPTFTFNEMIEHLRILYDETVFDNPELPISNDQDFQWEPSNIEPMQLESQAPSNNEPEPVIESPTETEPAIEKESTEKMEVTPRVPKIRKRAASPSTNSTTSTPATEVGRRSSRQRNPQNKEEEEAPPTTPKIDKRKSVKEPSRASTRATPSNDSIGTRLRGQK